VTVAPLSRPRGRARRTESAARPGRSRPGTKLMILLLSAGLFLLLFALGLLRGIG